MTRIGTFAGGVVTRVGTFSDTETREQAKVRTAAERQRDGTIVLPLGFQRWLQHPVVSGELPKDETSTRHGRPGPAPLIAERESSTVN